LHAYPVLFPGGARVAARDMKGDGKADIICGGGPQVTAYDGVNQNAIANFYAYGSGFTGGVRLGDHDVNGDGRADVITGAGPGGGPQMKYFDCATLAVLGSVFAYSPAFAGGMFVG
jgi:serralysin